MAYDQLIGYVSGALSAISLLALIWVVIKLNRLDQIRKEFLTSEIGKDLEQVLVEQNRAITKLRADLTTANEQINRIANENLSHFQKIGFIRFNPFDDAGGNISFALCLLNSKNDGVVISSLHGREGTRMYAKAVKNGQSESKLTDEEQEAITNAK